MKNHFYKIAMLLFVCGLLTVSCKKENAAPAAQKQTSSNAKTSGSAVSTTPDTPSSSAPPSGCPGHK
jgi:hypothetical protein